MVDVTWLADLALFAAEQGDDKGGVFGGWSSMFMLWLPIIFLFYWLLIRPQRREQAKRQAMLSELKKNDAVIVAGGIYGVVAEVDHEANRVTVKVDEKSNVRLRVTLSSVIPVPPDRPPDGNVSSK